MHNISKSGNVNIFLIEIIKPLLYNYYAIITSKGSRIVLISYEGDKCPVCHAILFDDDDIVVCPDCGTPYHRDCYEHIGQCVNAGRHGTNWRYVHESEKHAADSPDQDVAGAQAGRGKKCPNCGAISSSGTIFCPYCGYQFGSAYNPGQGPINGSYDYPVRVIDPLGGTDPRADIDGVPASALMPFIAVNTQRYIPKFANMSQKKKKASWNWAAFLIPGYWLLYRKCYTEGIIALAISFISMLLNIPMNTVTNSIANTLPYGSSYGDLFDAISNNLSLYTPGVIICAVLSIVLILGLMIFMGIFGDSIYKRHCVNAVREITESGDTQKQHELTAKKGSVNFIVPIAAYAAYYFISIIISLIL